jgi:hypothetical protein
LAHEYATFAGGVATRHRIHLRADRLAAASLVQRVGLIAHELAHSSQYALAGGERGSSEQWLREGAADWVRFQVLEALGLVPPPNSMSRLRDVSQQRLPEQHWPNLLALSSHAQWVTARTTYGPTATYGQAVLAVHWLVERASTAALVDYFRRAARPLEAGPLFQAAFGMTREAFGAAWEAEREALAGGEPPGMCRHVP